jgi:hypothetical protein
MQSYYAFHLFVFFIRKSAFNFFPQSLNHFFLYFILLDEEFIQ